MDLAATERRAGGTGTARIRVIKGDITELDVDAFVFYAQHDLELGSGFGGAIAVRGGPSIQKELSTLGPLETGEAIATGAGKLKAEGIIHAAGPRFQERDTEAKLRRTVLSALACAEEKGFKRVAFPAMGAGYYGIPPALSARVTVEAVRSHFDSGSGSGIDEIVVCVFDTPQFEAYEAVVAAGQ